MESIIISNKDIMASTSEKQANAGAIKSVPKMPMDKLKRFIKMKESLSLEGKRKLLHALKLSKGCNNNIAEDIVDEPERNPVAKTFDTKSDFDSYVNQRRGIEMTPKEQQSILSYKRAKPTQQDKFFIKFETSDDFGNNETTVIKKLKEGNQFCWTAFSKTEQAESEAKPAPIKEAIPPVAKPPVAASEQPSEVVVDDPIRITKSITFTNDIEGSDILADLLRKLDL